VSEAGSERNILDIMRLLPHRYPFLLVDRIVSMTPPPVVPGSRVAGLKNVSVNEPFFQGHFPGNPVMPGVLILECMAQVGGCLFFTGVDEPQKTLMYLSGVDKARFRRPVYPGDQLNVAAEIVQVRSNVVRMRADARVDGSLCAEAEFMSSLVRVPAAAR